MKVELASELRAHYLSIPHALAMPSDHGKDHGLFIHSHCEEVCYLLTLAWESISNFPNFPSPLAGLLLATVDSLPTQTLVNADAALTHVH